MNKQRKFVEFSTYLRGTILLQIMKKNRRLKMMIDCRTIKKGKQGEIYIELNESVAMKYSTQKSTQKKLPTGKSCWGGAWPGDRYFDGIVM